MAGLALRVGGFGGVGSTDDPTYGTQQSYSTVTAQAFGPGATIAPESTGQALHPTKPVGAAMYVGVAAVVLLVCIRRTLPQ